MPQRWRDVIGFPLGCHIFFAPGIVGARDGLCVVARDLENSDNHATPW